MRDLVDTLWTPLRALVVAAAGVGLARACVEGRLGSGWGAVASFMVFIVTFALVGFLAEWVDREQLPNHPVAAVVLMEWWTLAPLAVAVGASALAIIATIRWSPGETAAVATKELTEQATTAVTTFLTAGFVAWTADQDQSPVADRIKDALRSHYQRGVAGGPLSSGRIRYLKPESKAERLVYSDALGDVSGWGYSARRRRARELASELQLPRSKP
jgi:hypothetical protein